MTNNNSGHNAVLIEINNGVAWLTLNRPGSLNSMNWEMIEGLDNALTVIESEPAVRVAVVTGAGEAFSAGGDLREVLGKTGRLQPSAIMKLVRYASKTFSRFTTIEKPIIAAVNGVAVAGGLEITMSCDLVVAAESARLGDGHVNYGVLPGAGGAVRLARIVGPTIARYLTFTGEIRPAQEFLTWGLINRVVPDSELNDCVSELATKLAQKSPLCLAHMKRLVREALDQPLTTALEREHEALEQHTQSDDMLEGLVAFTEKRAPAYVGR